MCISSSFYDKESDWYSSMKAPRVNMFYLKYHTLINIKSNRQKNTTLIGDKSFNNISIYHLKEY